MNEAIRQLPTDIRWYILRYLSISITADVSEDIRHFGKCKYRLEQTHYIFHSYYLLDYALSCINIPHLREKYVRQIIVPQEQGYNFHPDIKRISVIQNATLIKCGKIDFDKTQYKYTVINRTGITHDLQCWRALYNILCMMDTRDREIVMTELEYYYTNILNNDEEEEVYY